MTLGRLLGVVLLDWHISLTFASILNRNLKSYVHCKYKRVRLTTKYKNLNQDKTHSTKERIVKYTTHTQIGTSDCSNLILIFSWSSRGSLRGGFFLFLADSPAAHTRLVTKKSSRAQSSGRVSYTRSRVQKKDTEHERTWKKWLNTRYTSCSLQTELKNLKKSISRGEQMKHAYWWGIFRGMIAVCRVMCVPTL